MERFLIETPHDAGDCHRLVEEITNAGYLHFFEWGCASGVHCGWAIVETISLANAEQIVPPMVRQRARVIKLNHFEDVDPLHAGQA